MEQVARMPAADRRDLIEETAARKGMIPAVVEKDFWVCWALNRIYSNKTLAKKLLFKGGTTLSKIFQLIERFSEDIDLVLRPEAFTDADLVAARSKTGQRKAVSAIKREAAAYIHGRLLRELQETLGDLCGIKANEPHAEETPIEINIEYNPAFADRYLKPAILLEIGPLALWAPNERYTIRPYIAEVLPDAIAQSECAVQAVTAERTFWEKATILHSEAGRPESKPIRKHHSRHYYDVYRMAGSAVKSNALADLALLNSVVEFKQKCFPTSWADYEKAKPGSFKLLPPSYAEHALASDYREMREVMIYGEAPSYDEMLTALAGLEGEINSL